MPTATAFNAIHATVETRKLVKGRSRLRTNGCRFSHNIRILRTNNNNKQQQIPQIKYEMIQFRLIRLAFLC